MPCGLKALFVAGQPIRTSESRHRPASRASFLSPIGQSVRSFLAPISWAGLDSWHRIARRTSQWAIRRISRGSKVRYNATQATLIGAHAARCDSTVMALNATLCANIRLIWKISRNRQHRRRTRKHEDIVGQVGASRVGPCQDSQTRRSRHPVLRAVCCTLIVMQDWVAAIA